MLFNSQKLGLFIRKQCIKLLKWSINTSLPSDDVCSLLFFAFAPGRTIMYLKRNGSDLFAFIVKCPVKAECDTGTSALGLLLWNRKVAKANVC